MAYVVVLSLGKAWIYSDSDECLPEPADVGECTEAPNSGSGNVLVEVGDSDETTKEISVSGLTADHMCPSEIDQDNWDARSCDNGCSGEWSNVFEVSRCGNDLTITRTDGDWDMDLSLFVMKIKSTMDMIVPNLNGLMTRRSSLGAVAKKIRIMTKVITHAMSKKPKDPLILRTILHSCRDSRETWRQMTVVTTTSVALRTRNWQSPLLVIVMSPWLFSLDPRCRWERFERLLM